MKLYSGQTLMGLLISITISSFLLIVISKFYVFSQTESLQWQQRLQLQNELQRILQLISKDIRRAGARSLNPKLQQHNFSLFLLNGQQAWNIAQDNGETKNSCAVFLYDLNGDGCIGNRFTGHSCIKNNRNNTAEISTELFGYRLSQKTIKTRTLHKKKTNDHCVQQDCEKYLQAEACSTGSWTDLLDSQQYAVKKLEFTPIENGKGIKIELAGFIRNKPEISYEASSIIPLLNQ